MTLALPETEIHARVRREQICIVTGEVLDPMTAVSVYEPTGEILVAVLSPRGWDLAKDRLARTIPAAIIVTPQRVVETLPGEPTGEAVGVSSAISLDTEESVVHS